LGSIRQTAFVVRDIEAAASEWVDRYGIGPWFIGEMDFPDTVYRGKKTRLHAKGGLAQSGDMQIELIEPDLSIPSVYTEFLDAGGTGVHHVCYWCNLDTARTHFGANGSAQVQGGIALRLEFLYMEGFAGFPYIEFIDPDPEQLARFRKIADAAVDWDGTDPIRSRA
jgi:hypothetical protein